MSDKVSSYPESPLESGDKVSSFLNELAGRIQAGWQTVVVAVPFFWLLIFFLAPFFIVLKISLAESLIASPPFSPLFEFAEEGVLAIRLVFDNFSYLWEDELYVGPTSIP